VTLHWTAPADAAGQSVAEYDLRTSTFPPGTNIQGWFDNAMPHAALPVPQTPGSTEIWHHSGFAPGQTVYFAIKARSADGVWSAVSEIYSWTPPSTPLLQDAAPLSLGSGVNSVTLSGLGLGDVSVVRFFHDDGSYTAGTGLTNQGNGDLTLTVDLPQDLDSELDVYVSGPQGSDWLRGWLRTSASAPPPPPPPVDEGPSVVSNLTAEALDVSTVRLTWAAPVDNAPDLNAAAASYDLRRMGGTAANWDWDSGTAITTEAPRLPGWGESLTFTGLEPGSTVAYALTSADADGNVSNLSNLAQVTLPEVPPVVPNAVTDLAGSAVDTATVSLVWTAPQDPGAANGIPAACEVRRVHSSQGIWNWDDGIVMASPTPRTPGSEHSASLGGLVPGATYAFAVKTLGQEGAWSSISNVVVLTLPRGFEPPPPPPDTTPPVAVTNLEVSQGDADNPVLLWTAPADDDGSAVVAYEARRWNGTANDFPWGEAETLDGFATPRPPGSDEMWTGGAVDPGTVASFALISRDEAGNESPVSNIVTWDRSGDDVIRPALEQTYLEASRKRRGGVQIRWRAGGDDGFDGRASAYELVLVANPNLGTTWWEGAPSAELARSPKPSGKREFHDVAGLAEGVVHGFAIRSLDEAGNVSEWIRVLLATDGSSGSLDAAPPTAPGGVSATWSADEATIRWDASPDANATEYRVYRRHDGSGSLAVATVHGGVRELLDPGTYLVGTQYLVLACDSDGNESSLGVWVNLDPVLDAPVVRVRPQGSGWSLEVPRVDPPAGTLLEEPRVRIFDVTGRLMAEVSVTAEAQGWRGSWSGQTRTGRTLPNGIFFVRVSQGGQVRTQKILLQR